MPCRWSRSITPSTAAPRQDEADKAGTANLAADLLDEGAGDLDGKTFHERLENHAIELGFQVSARLFPRLAAHAQRAPRRGLRSACGLALTAPRFDADAVERVRGQVLASLRRESTNPNSHRQPRAGGRRRSPAILTAVKAAARSRRCRASPPTTCATTCAASSRATSLTISIVGDIDAKTAGDLIDRAFAAPAGEERPQAGRQRQPARARPPHRHRSRRAAGGGHLRRPGPRPPRSRFHGRLYRQSHPGRRHASPRGSTAKCARSAGSPTASPTAWSGSAAPRSCSAAPRPAPTAPATRWRSSSSETKRMAENGPTAEELAAAKSYLKGAYALSLDTSAKIAAQLTQIQLDNLGIDYIQRRGALIDAVDASRTPSGWPSASTAAACWSPWPAGRRATRPPNGAGREPLRRPCPVTAAQIVLRRP